MTVLKLPTKLKLRIFACEVWRRQIGEADVLEVQTVFHPTPQGAKRQMLFRCVDKYQLDGAIASIRRTIKSQTARRFCIAERYRGKFIEMDDFYGRTKMVRRDRGDLWIEILECSKELFSCKAR